MVLFSFNLYFIVLESWFSYDLSMPMLLFSTCFSMVFCGFYGFFCVGDRGLRCCSVAQRLNLRCAFARNMGPRHTYADLILFFIV